MLPPAEAVAGIATRYDETAESNQAAVTLTIPADGRVT